MKTLSSVLGNSQKLDGGAMFGNVPKALWSQWLQPDPENRITLACRALLVEDKGKKILLETGIGSFFEPKLKLRYGVIEVRHKLLDSLAALGLQHEDIDFVILSHLHFDHAGGLLSAWQEGQTPQLLFPNARYLVGKEAWNRAQQPHFRDRASFIQLLNNLLAASQRLVVIDTETTPLLGNDYHFHFSNGHTPGMMLTEIAMPEGAILFSADLIPGINWIHLPITMGYDRAAEQLVDEKQKLLKHMLSINGRIFYTHDPRFALSNIQQDDKGCFSAVNGLEQMMRLEH
jgi:glyoxylase-like metal-dependent hydrolase (beta-lactamase superfamily II)